MRASRGVGSWFRLISGLLGVAMLVAACGDGSDPAPSGEGAQDGEPTQVRVIALEGIMTLLPFYMGVETGAYEEAGLEVDVQTVGSGSDAAKLFLSGRSDLAVMAAAHAIRGVAIGRDVKIIQSLTTDSTLDIVTKKGEIEPGDWDALKGKTCGATGPGSDTDLLLRAVLEQQGLEPDQDVTFTYTGDTSAAISGLERGELDCFLALPGMRAEVILNDIAEVFYAFADDEALADGPSIVVAAQGGFIDDHPDAVQAFVDVTLQQVETIYQDTDQAREIAYEAFEGFSQEAIDFELDQFVAAEAFPREGEQPPGSYEDVGQIYVDADLFPQLPPYEDVYETSFLP